MCHYLKKHQIEAIFRFGNHIYHECFLQYFEGCLRVASFHLSNFNIEVYNELQSRFYSRNYKLD